MAHHVLLVDPQYKKVITAEVANRPGRTIVFVRTKLGADRVAQQLREQGVLAAALHGGLSQGVREPRPRRVPGGHPPGARRDRRRRLGHPRRRRVGGAPGRPARGSPRTTSTAPVAPLAPARTEPSSRSPLLHQRRTMERQLQDAGVDAAPVKAVPGDAVIADTGGRTPTGVPVADDVYRRLLEAEKRPRRGPGGPRGSWLGPPRRSARRRPPPATHLSAGVPRTCGTRSAADARLAPWPTTRGPSSRAVSSSRLRRSRRDVPPVRRAVAPPRRGRRPGRHPQPAAGGRHRRGSPRMEVRGLVTGDDVPGRSGRAQLCDRARDRPRRRARAARHQASVRWAGSGRSRRPAEPRRAGGRRHADLRRVCGWSGGQLENEIRRGDWHVVASESPPRSAAPERLWSRCSSARTTASSSWPASRTTRRSTDAASWVDEPAARPRPVERPPAGDLVDRQIRGPGTRRVRQPARAASPR